MVEGIDSSVRIASNSRIGDELEILKRIRIFRNSERTKNTNEERSILTRNRAFAPHNAMCRQWVRQ